MASTSRRKIEISYQANTRQAVAEISRFSKASAQSLQRVQVEARKTSAAVTAIGAGLALGVLRRGLAGIARGMADVWQETARWRGENDSLIQSARGVHSELTRVEAAIGTVVVGALESTGALGAMREGARRLSDAILDSSTTIGALVRGPLHLMAGALGDTAIMAVRLQGVWQTVQNTIEVAIHGLVATFRGLVARIARSVADLATNALLPLYQMAQQVPEALRPAGFEGLETAIGGTIVALQLAATAQEELYQGAIDARTAAIAEGQASRTGSDAAIAGIQARIDATHAAIDATWQLADAAAGRGARGGRGAVSGAAAGGVIGGVAGAAGLGGRVGASEMGVTAGGAAGGAGLGGALGAALAAQQAAVAQKEALSTKIGAAADEMQGIAGVFSTSLAGMSQNWFGTLGAMAGGLDDWGAALKATLASTMGDMGSALLQAAASGIGSMAMGPLAILGLGGAAFSLAAGLLGGGSGSGTTRNARRGSAASAPGISEAIRPETSRGSQARVVQLSIGAVFSRDESRRAVSSYMREAAALGEIR